MNTITIKQPDDWHCHLRDDIYLQRTVSDTAARFHRALIMPNLLPPITTVIQADAYRQRILAHLPQNSKFQPLMTLYLNEQVTEETLITAKKSDYIIACKLYPAGATTHSQAGVNDISRIYPLLDCMQTLGLVLCIHGEVTDTDIDIFDREKIFIFRILTKIVQHFPQLKIVLEHISSKESVEFVRQAPRNLAATITPHHLLYNRNDLLVSGLKPHYYCLPILKTREDQETLIQAAISGENKFFLGTDSAPHVKSQKESACGCAGIYSAHAAIELYAEVFSKHNAMHNLERFASLHGAQFYGLPINQNTLTLTQLPWEVPNALSFGDNELVPLRHGEKIVWRIQN